jgi:hypothetical protein
MMRTTPVSPDDDQPRMIERPDGFYWQDKVTGEEFGPFATLAEAMRDMQSQNGNGFGEGETLEEAEAEIGIADWIDPETGQPAEDSPPHFNDE